ncbi:hypothetical protein LG047_15345 [Methylocystis sp. WRRC1]|uniref:hypothetical protein n=1 Tax=Methylocystis sp. WRRC1 TaxID=1732014 RepID=UPI001D14598C|nr:hypothetical protein [Methylocystis sp. WRRC1]MCC3246675.1 hypothetical protein [Methylocystis sp. WRRC1]
MKASDEILSRYNRIERELDGLGRTIGVRRLKPSQQIKVQGLTPDLEGSGKQINPETGEEMLIPHRAPAILAASVVEIDGVPIPFPKTRGELDSVLDHLDSEGLTAAGAAMMRLMVGDEDGGIDAAKNSARTPTSDSASGSSETASLSTSPSPSTTTNLPPTA